MKLEIAYGNLSDGKNSVIFLPAFPTPREMYINQIKLLDKHGIPYISLNYPGVGNSQKPDKIEMSVRDLVRVIIDNIKGLRFNKLIPIGTSMGGYVMFEMWRQMKERIAGFVFCHTRPENLDEEARKKRLSDIEKINENIEEYLKVFSKNLVSDYTYENKPEVVRFINDIVKKTTKEGLFSLVYVIATRPDSRELLSQINVPSLVVAGKSDKIVPVDIMRDMADRLPNSMFVELDNVGHLSPLEVPEEFNSILLSFLESKALV
ncbi:MAG: alpha/beta hydrolase [Brevinematales bacterium]|nr:alpha/beta hydrolase [Brevinematales bacterium]